MIPTENGPSSLDNYNIKHMANENESSGITILYNMTK